MAHELANPRLGRKHAISLLVGSILFGCLRSGAAQTAIQTWEGRQESFQQDRRSAGARTQQGERAARATLRQLYEFLVDDNPFDPDRAARALALAITERSGRFTPSSLEFVVLKPTSQATPITAVSIVLKPETASAFRGNELRISLSSERLGCITLSDLEVVFGSAYEPARKLPFQPPWMVEIPVDVAVYRIDGPQRRSISFNFQFLDCLGSIETLELLR